MAACCTVVFPAGFQGKSFRHKVEGDWYRFENVLGNQFHRTECMKSSHSILTNHRVLYCNDKRKRSSKEGEKIDNKRWAQEKSKKETEKKNLRGKVK